VVVIAGPTASGKSALALALALARDGVVINADSMQLYAELSLLTARPEAPALALAPHRLYGILPATEPGSAARWRDLAVAEIRAAHQAGRLPIVTGGTGLYLKALLEGLAEMPPVPSLVRQQAVALWQELGGEGLRQRLAEYDPLTAARLQPGDRQRLVRAWEVWAASGVPLSQWQAAPASGPPPGLRFTVVVLDPPREALYRACDGRLRTMVERGALAEVAALMALGLDPQLPAMKSLGVPELRRHLLGELTLEQALSAAQIATRHYAKRQLTWFRHQLAAPPVPEPPARSGSPLEHACHVMGEQYSESLLQKIFAIVCD